MAFIDLHAMQTYGEDVEVKKMRKFMKNCYSHHPLEPQKKKKSCKQFFLAKCLVYYTHFYDIIRMSSTHDICEKAHVRR